MTETIKNDEWVYVLVQKSGQTETIVGQRDTQNDIDFIPLFKTRDTALQGITQLVKESDQTFEIQAIIYEDLLRYANNGSFLLFVLDGRGRILSKLTSKGELV